LSQSILIALASVVGLGVACQWLAWRLRLPAILLLLLAGMAVGPGSAVLVSQGLLPQRLMDPDQLFGTLLLPIVSLSVALILFEGGLTLNVHELRQGTGIIWRLVTLGALVSWVLSAIAARYLIGFPWGLAVLLGAILVVTGPTVIGPLLRHVRPTGVVGPVLRWEGIIIDPIGALLAVIVFEVIASGHEVHAAPILRAIGGTLAIGGGLGLAAATVFAAVVRFGWAPDYLQNPIAVMFVLLIFAIANALQHEAGLAAVTVMGVVLANQRRVSVHHVLEFKESLSVLLIASLFILLGARLDPAQLAQIDWRVLLFVVALVLVIRPASVYLATARTSLSSAERSFIAAMAPRGIVAAAVASVFALRLREQGYPEAERLVPVTFAVVAMTVLIYGLGAPRVSRRLGLSRPGASGFLIVGADAVAREIASALVQRNAEVLLVDTSDTNTLQARLNGLPVLHGSALAPAVAEQIALSSIGRVLALTPNGKVNALAATQYARIFGRQNVYQLPAEANRHQDQQIARDLRGQDLFGESVTHATLAALLADGATIETARLTRELDYDSLMKRHDHRAIPLFLVTERDEVLVFSADRSSVTPRAGMRVIAMVPRSASGERHPPLEAASA
jgi:NhaP-type Na+/H+ or K+/H+ antiporter